MAEKTSPQLAQIIMLLHELKGELQEARADIRSLQVQANAAKNPRQMRAVITLPFTYELGDPSIELTVEEWNRVKAGETVKLSGKGLNPEAVFLGLDHWEFSGGIGGTVKLDVEFEGRRETEQTEILDAEMIEEFAVTPSV